MSRKQVTCAAVLSDVHGNAVALEAVLEELSEESGELIVFGGDLTWGPLPEETLALGAKIATPTLYVRGTPSARSWNRPIDLLRSSPTRSDVIEDAERREFAG